MSAGGPDSRPSAPTDPVLIVVRLVTGKVTAPVAGDAGATAVRLRLRAHPRGKAGRLTMATAVCPPIKNRTILRVLTASQTWSVGSRKTMTALARRLAVRVANRRLMLLDYV